MSLDCLNLYLKVGLFEGLPKHFLLGALRVPRMRRFTFLLQFVMVLLIRLICRKPFYRNSFAYWITCADLGILKCTFLELLRCHLDIIELALNIVVNAHFASTALFIDVNNGEVWSMLFNWGIFLFARLFCIDWRLVLESRCDVTRIHHLKIMGPRLYNHILVIYYWVRWRFIADADTVSALISLKRNDFYIHCEFLRREFVENPVFERHSSLLSHLKSRHWIFVCDVLVIYLIPHSLELGSIRHIADLILCILLLSLRRLASWLCVSGSNLS